MNKMLRRASGSVWILRVFLAFLLVAGTCAAQTCRLSARMSAMIASRLPHYGEVPDVPIVSAPRCNDDRIDSMVVALPRFLVLAQRLPTPQAMAGPAGRTEAVMSKYLGSSAGFDRGVLNRLTIPEIWSKIPVLRLLPFVGPNGTMTNAQRAEAMERASALHSG